MHWLTRDARYTVENTLKARWVPRNLALAAMMLWLVGCSSGSDSGEPVVSPSASPTAAASPSPSPSASPSPSPAVTLSPSPSPDTSPAPTATPTGSPAVTPGNTPAPSPSTTPSATPSPAPTITASPSATPSPTPLGTPSPAPTAATYVPITGVVQKGLFNQLNMNARQLNQQGGGVRQLPVSVNNQGGYQMQAPVGALIELEATGQFVDELSGETITLETPLYTLFRVAGPQTENINILTHIMRGMALKPPPGFSGGAGALSQRLPLVENKLRNGLGFAAGVDLNTLDFSKIKDDADLSDPHLSLLLLSAALMNEQRLSGRMPVAWEVINKQLGQGKIDIVDLFDLFNGWDARELERLIRLAGQIVLPNLQIPDDMVWVCNLICSWQPQPGISIAGTSAFESYGELVMVVRRSGDFSDERQINLHATSGSALDGIDFVGGSRVVTLPANVRDVRVSIPLLIDDVSEGVEQFQVQIDGDESINNASASAGITDQEPPGLRRDDGTSVDLARACFVSAGAAAELRDEPCQNPVNALEGLVGDDAELALRLAIVLQTSCNSGGNRCAARMRDWPVELTLYVVDAQQSVQAQAAMGTYAYFGADVLYLDDPLSDAPQILVSLAGQALQDLLDVARASPGYRLRLQVDGAFVDAPIVAELPLLIPLEDEVQFGDLRLPLLPGNIVLDDAPGALCPSGDVLLDGRYLTYQPGFDDATLRALGSDPQAADAPYVLGGQICVSLTPNAGRSAITATDADIDLSESLWPLPDGHGTELPQLPGVLLPMLYVGNTATPLTLMTEWLPFGMRIDGGRLTENGAQLSVNGLRFLQHRAMSSQDPRHDLSLLASNDVLYQSSVSSSLKLTPQGLDGTLSFAGGNGRISVPAGQISWDAFNVYLRETRFYEWESPVVTYRFDQSADCRDAGCLAGTALPYEVRGQLIRDDKGFAVGDVLVQATQQPAFGRKGEGRFAFARPDDLMTDDRATLALAGYRFDAQSDVVSALNAHLNFGGNGLEIHPVGSEAYRLGNYAPIGLSVGPQIYSDATGVPQLGGGRSLAGKALRVDSGGDISNLSASVATKYVLRPGGFTGVFNANLGGAGQTLRLSGYDMAMSRFAIRAVDNQIDETTWLDGGFDLAGDAQISDILFAGLQIDCAANLGQGRLVFELCDQSDDNGNGVVDENCPTALGSWQMPSVIGSLKFTDASGDVAAQCGDDPLFATLSQSVHALALDRPIAMQIGWSPDGYVRFQQSRGLGEFALDATQDKAGFATQVSKARLNCVDGNANDRLLSCTDFSGGQEAAFAWMDGEALVGLPFWNAVEADYRLFNSVNFGLSLDGYVAAPSALLPRGELDGQNLARNNQALMAGLADNSALQFDVSYSWGNTGFGFRLPAYFAPMGLDGRELSSFIGVRKSIDLLVLEAGAGINFIESDRTKFSFGASADIQALQELQIQMDLGNPDSLAKVDALLIKSRVVKGPVLEPLFSDIQDKLNVVNRFAGRGLDTLTEEGLTRSLEEGGEAIGSLSPYREDPLVTLSKGLAELHSAPDQVIGLLRSEILQPTLSLLDQAEQSVREPGLRLLSEVENWQLDPSPLPQVPAEVRSALTQLSAASGQLHSGLSQVAGRIGDEVARAQSVVAQGQDAVAKIEYSLAEIDSLLRQASQVVSTVCGGSLTGEASGYVAQLFASLDVMRTVLNLAKGSDLLVPIIQLAAQDETLAQALQDGQQAVSRNAQDLLERLGEVEERLKTSVCSSQVADMMTEADDLLDQIDTEVQRVSGVLNTASSQLDQLSALTTTVRDQIVAPLNTFNQTLARAEDMLDQIDQQVANPPDAADVKALLDDYITGSALFASGLGVVHPMVNTVIADPRDPAQVDILDFLAAQITQRVESEFDQVERTIRTQLAGVLPGASYSPDELRRMLVMALMDAPPVRNLRAEADKQMAELRYKLNSLVLDVTDQVNMAVKGAVAKVEGEINELLADATAPLKAIPLQSASMDGFAVIAGDELERAHLGAQWTMGADAEGQDPKTFGAALDAVSWSANNKTGGCSIPQGQSRLDVTLSAFNLPARFGSSDITMKKIYMGFTLDQSGNSGIVPKGVFGGLQTQGEIAFTEFKIFDPAFAAGVGDRETYVGAAAGAVFSAIAVEAAFLAGRTCNQDILLELDPNVAQFIPIPDSGFFGAYVRGSASIPVWTNGCPLTIGVAADAGAWLLAGPPLTVGGLVGGGAYGKVGCVGAIRGQIRALGTVNTDGDFVFAGEGFGAAGLGLCEPAGWTSVERSRADSFCGTADARIAASFDGSWKLLDMSISALH